MEYILTVLGSIASVGSIPLAIYLYLRSREAKYSSLRREIARILSYQIGEGRELSTFEVQAVIDSKIRENKLKTNSIAVREVVEDLVAETITSPMLNSEQKAEIVENLRRLYDRGKILQAIDRYGVSYHLLLSSIGQKVRLLPEDAELVAKEAPSLDESEQKKEKQSMVGTASMFGLLAAIVSIVGASFPLFADRFNKLWSGGEILLNVFIGFVASIIAALATFLIKKYLDSATNHNERS
jgi:F0F1-type ATP synthase assembly protein I